MNRSGVGNGNPLQYSCLENPMNRGAWRSIVHGVSKCQTWLSMHTHTHIPNTTAQAIELDITELTHRHPHMPLLWSKESDRTEHTHTHAHTPICHSSTTKSRTQLSARAHTHSQTHPDSTAPMQRIRQDWARTHTHTHTHTHATALVQSWTLLSTHIHPHIPLLRRKD